MKLGRPILSITIPYEGSVSVTTTAMNDLEYERLMQWIEASHERSELLTRAVDLMEEPLT